MIDVQSNILASEGARVARARYPYVLLAILCILIVTYKLFIQHGLAGALLLLILATTAFFGLLDFSYRSRGNGGRRSEMHSLAVVSFVLTLLLGEFGSATESNITFLVSVWKLLILVLLCFVVRADSAHRFVLLRSVVRNPVASAFVLTVCAVLLTSTLQLIVLDVSVKGCIRAITFYGTLLAALYCAVGLLRQKADFALARTVFRWVLLILIGFAIFEMISGFHLPTSWLNGDDPTALAKQNQIAGRGIWITATGPCYNQNDFCLILAVIGCLSLPSRGESRFRFAAALVLVTLDLVLVASLGSTIVSMGMLAAVALWGLAFQWRLRFKIAWITCAVAGVFFVSGAFFAQTGVLAELVQGSSSATTGPAAGSTAVLNDFAVQSATYEQGYGSMWMRLTLYQQLISSIGANPLGVGPASIHAFLTENPTASGLIDPHNWWLEFALEYGWIPTLLYVSFNILLVIKLLRCREACDGYTLSICAALCAMYVGSIAPSSSDFNVLLWIPVLLGCAFLLSPMGCCVGPDRLLDRE